MSTFPTVTTGRTHKVVNCQPDKLGNTTIAVLVTPGEVYISAHGEHYNSVVLTVEDLDRIRTEMARLEGVK